MNKHDCPKCGWVTPNDDSGELRCPKCNRPVEEDEPPPSHLNAAGG